MIATTDRMVAVKNYSYYLDLDLAPTGNGFVIYWTDYIEGYSMITMQKMDQNGSMVQGRVSIKELGHDLYSPRVSEINGTLYLFYLKTEGDPMEARSSKVQESSVHLRTFDSSLNPSGRFPEGTSLGRFRTETVRVRILRYDLEFLIWFDIEDEGYLGMDHGNTTGIRIPITGPEGTVGSDSDLRENCAVIRVQEGTAPSLTLIEKIGTRVSLVPMTDGNGSVSTNFLVRKDLKVCDELYIYSADGKLLANWTLNGEYGSYKSYILGGNGIYLVWDKPQIAFLPFNGRDPVLMDLDVHCDDSTLRWSSSSDDEDLIVAWSIEITVESGDDETTETFVKFVSFGPEMDRIKAIDSDYDWKVALFHHTSKDSIAGVALIGGVNGDYHSFVMDNGGIRTEEKVAGLPKVGLIAFILGISAPFLLIIPTFIFMNSFSRMRSLQRMSDADLMDEDERSLRKAIGRRAKRMDRSQMIEYIRNSKGNGPSPEESLRLRSFFPLKFIYFTMFLASVPVIIITIASVSPSFTPYRPGVGVILEVLILTVLLSLTFVLVLEERGKGPLRTLSVLLMALVLFVGQVSLAFVTFLIIDRAFLTEYSYDLLLNIIPGTIILGFLGPFLMLYDIYRKPFILICSGLVLFPIIVSFWTVGHLTRTIDILPTAAYISTSLSVFLGIGIPFSLIFTGGVCGMVMGSIVSLREIKPRMDWTVKDLKGLVKLHFALPVFTGVLISSGTFYIGAQSGLLKEGVLIIVMMVLMGAVILSMGPVLWFNFLGSLKTREGLKDLDNNLMFVSFSPLLTLFGGLILALVLGTIGFVVGVIPAVLQFIIAYHRLGKQIPGLIEKDPFEVKSLGPWGFKTPMIPSEVAAVRGRDHVRPGLLKPPPGS